MKTEQITKDQLIAMRKAGKFDEIVQAQKDGRLNTVQGLAEPEDTGDTGDDATPWTLSQLQAAFRAKLYSKINSAGQRGLLTAVLSGDKGETSNDD
jgi:hypothetical protein